MIIQKMIYFNIFTAVDPFFTSPTGTVGDCPWLGHLETAGCWVLFNFDLYLP